MEQLVARRAHIRWLADVGSSSVHSAKSDSCFIDLGLKSKQKQGIFVASLDTKEYEHLLNKHNFKVLKYVENDPDCGHAKVWMAQYTWQVS